MYGRPTESERSESRDGEGSVDDAKEMDPATNVGKRSHRHDEEEKWDISLEKCDAQNSARRGTAITASKSETPHVQEEEEDVKLEEDDEDNNSVESSFGYLKGERDDEEDGSTSCKNDNSVVTNDCDIALMQMWGVEGC